MDAVAERAVRRISLRVMPYVFLLYIVAFLVRSLTVLFHVSYSSLFVSIVPRESYVEANSFLAGSRAFSFVAGPSVGGILVQALKAQALFNQSRSLP